MLANEWGEFGVRATQMEAMQALVGDLPRQDGRDDRKGKVVGIPNWVGNGDGNVWGEDCSTTATPIRLSWFYFMLILNGLFMWFKDFETLSFICGVQVMSHIHSMLFV
jgi:hypothetical protein